jgi:hypothetical protein
MSKNFLLIIFSILFLSACTGTKVESDGLELSGGLKVTEKPDESMVESGEFKEEACYSLEFIWNSKLGACARVRDIQTEDQKRAAALAIEKSGLGRGGLTITEIKAAACEGCYLVNLRQEKNSEVRSERVIIDGWEVEGVAPLEDGGEAAPIINGESVLNMMAVELMSLIPEFIEMRQAIMKWKTAEGERQIMAKSIKYGEGYGAREVFVTHQNILDGFKTLGFQQDELNTGTENGISISGFAKEKIICLVILSEAGESELELRCGERL